ncbi:hypothetical protein [Polyangium sp. 6x1]|uniref:hypothetical protein n=1 Tax=Polyangium sp. 6x1 TaxID=3042689 RepID=UPI002482C653|nr:hypothetical protein [Polyangium sp. 6x1]MDI1444656.1 hypothetical protein [Polyangium sp. 6x1]
MTAPRKRRRFGTAGAPAVHVDLWLPRSGLMATVELTRVPQVGDAVRVDKVYHGENALLGLWEVIAVEHYSIHPREWTDGIVTAARLAVRPLVARGEKPRRIAHAPRVRWGEPGS